MNIFNHFVGSSTNSLVITAFENSLCGCALAPFVEFNFTNVYFFGFIMRKRNKFALCNYTEKEVTVNVLGTDVTLAPCGIACVEK